MQGSSTWSPAFWGSDARTALYAMCGLRIAELYSLSELRITPDRHSMSVPLVAQTTYAELLERCDASSFSQAFSEDGTFSSKTIKDRRYWYFQTSTAQGRVQRY